MGDYYIENIMTKSGVKLRVGPAAVEPVSDIAALWALDNETFSKDATAFEEWCEATEPVPLMTRIPRYGESISVRVLSHRGNWIEGTATRYAEHPHSTLVLQTKTKIEGGTSGGPVVDSKGRLVGVISNSGRGNDKKDAGNIPIVCLALPQWILLRIAQAHKSLE